MTRRFIATLLAGAIAITGISTQTAQAGDRELARFLAGAAALVVIGAAIKKDNDRKRQAAAQPVYTEPQRQYKKTTKRHSHGSDNDVSRHDNRYNRYRHIEPRPLPRGVAKKLLPPQCKQTARTRSGPMSVYAADCLRDNYRYSHQLPQACQIRVHYGRDARLGYAYGTQCLINHGFDIASR
jgi:hypothetical protein